MKNWLGTACLSVALSLVVSQVWADAAPGSAIHGFGDYSVKPNYITPRGLLVTDEGVTSQILGGLVFLTSAKTSVVVGIWTDINHDPAVSSDTVGAWNEFDYFVGFNYSPSDKLKLGASYVVFLSPPGAFKTEQNIEFTANYDDSAGGPFSFQPYAKLFWAVDGDSTVVLGDRGNTFDVELGVTPTFKSAGGALTVTLPTWITVGPEDYWSGGTSEEFFPTDGSNFGVASTGITLKMPAGFVPPQFGDWYLYGGVQYYYLINDSLVDANSLTTGHEGGHDDVVNVFAGFGFGF
ncbi:MAG: hypothetical protein VX836_16215 [Pseudomonadota bacterium]|nr:hypothetical protein [Pseudomonadota bacterium]